LDFFVTWNILFFSKHKNNFSVNPTTMAKRMITVTELANELQHRLERNKTVDCCKTELLNLASMAKAKMGSELIEVDWKDS
jgi:hypothetical protein